VKSRLFASIAIGALVALGTTGCSMISPQATLIHYNPSDGVSATAGDIEIRNALIVADDEGTAGNFLAAVVNPTDSPVSVSIEFGEGADTVSEMLFVGANSTVSLGAEDEDPILVEGLELLPGTDVPVYFSAGDGGSLTAVPIVDGELPYYAPFVP
jgi:hypothetical protein